MELGGVISDYLAQGGAAYLLFAVINHLDIQGQFFTNCPDGLQCTQTAGQSVLIIRSASGIENLAVLNSSRIRRILPLRLIAGRNHIIMIINAQGTVLALAGDLRVKNGIAGSLDLLGLRAGVLPHSLHHELLHLLVFGVHGGHAGLTDKGLQQFNIAVTVCINVGINFFEIHFATPNAPLGQNLHCL